MAFYRATGQAHKPAPPVSTGKSLPSGNQGGKNFRRNLKRCSRNQNAKKIFWAGIKIYGLPQKC